MGKTWIGRNQLQQTPLRVLTHWRIEYLRKTLIVIVQRFRHKLGKQPYSQTDRRLHQLGASGTSLRFHR